MAGELIRGAAPNAPVEDVKRLAREVEASKPEVVVSVGGGSGIDAAKAALCLLALGDKHPDLQSYFGVGQVGAMLQAAGRKLLPLIAAQIASGSAAHLTKYSNVTYIETGQKMLIIDQAIVPPRALFDYAMTKTMDSAFTLDGAFDGIAHCLEVLYGSSGEVLRKAQPACLLGIELIVQSVRRAVREPADATAREALGLGTDLGGYAIMIGGTNGAHLNSFSLVDLLPHGRACALLNPYYTVFFAPAIEQKLRAVAAVYRTAGFLEGDPERLRGRALGVAVAEAMVRLASEVGFPTRLSEVPGFTPAHIERALEAARNPKLASKLQNMPVPLTADTVERYMRPVLEAAVTGDFSGIQTPDS
jgi:alcohol dehydrogenase class IV